MECKLLLHAHLRSALLHICYSAIGSLKFHNFPRAVIKYYMPYMLIGNSLYCLSGLCVNRAGALIYFLIYYSSIIEIRLYNELTKLINGKITYCTVLVSKRNDSCVASLAMLVPQTRTRHYTILVLEDLQNRLSCKCVYNIRSLCCCCEGIPVL